MKNLILQGINKFGIGFFCGKHNLLIDKAKISIGYGYPDK